MIARLHKLCRLLRANSRGAALLALSLLLMTGFAASLWLLNRTSHQFAEQMAVEQARNYSEALSAFRTLYTTTVVDKTKANGLQVRHDHLDHADAIPLPATLTNDLGAFMAAEHTGVKLRLYSDYPFPWRKEGGPADDFERRALKNLRANPDDPYFEFLTENETPLLRYATADRMRPACVDCHNTHPDTPRNDWKVGDVRGVLATSQPISAAGHTSASMLVGPAVSLTLTALLAIGLCILLMRNSHRHQEELATANTELMESNIESLLLMAEAKGARKSADHANHAKSDFLANMSHEIRTPLNGVIGLLELIGTKGLDNEQRGFVLTAQKSADHLLALINDVLDFSKLGAGSLELESRPFRPAKVARDLLDLLAVSHEASEVVLRTKMDEGVPECVLGDAQLEPRALSPFGPCPRSPLSRSPIRL